MMAERFGLCLGFRGESIQIPAGRGIGMRGAAVSDISFTSAGVRL
jgi:hypothetical protein